MNLGGYSKINCIEMFIEIETVNQLINFQYNDFKNFILGKQLNLTLILTILKLYFLSLPQYLAEMPRTVLDNYLITS
jgi:hypothetical protein